MWSFDSKFSAADPMEVTLTAPYARKGLLGKRGYKFTMTPGYDTIYMDYNSGGTRLDLLNSFTGDFDLMLVMSDRWFSTYNLNVHDDKSLMPAAANQDMSAIKITAKKAETFLLDESKKQALITYIDYVDNLAVGSQEAYTKIDVGVAYSAPIQRYKNTNWNSSLTAYLMNYSNYLGNGARHDTDLSLSLGLSKIYTERWTWTNSVAYTNNQSNQSSYAYDKYSITTSVTFNWDDAPKD